MIADPFFLHSVVTAYAEIATAMENMTSDDPDYDEKHTELIAIALRLEAVIVRETTRR